MAKARRSDLFCCLALLTALVLCVFWRPFFSGHTLFTPDSAPFFTHDFREQAIARSYGVWLDRLLGTGRGGYGFHPSRLMAAILPPSVFHVASYVVNTLLLSLAGLFFVRGRGIRGVAAYLPAIALGFSGYAFTLISAGHRTMFDMMPWVVFLFGFVDRAAARRDMLCFAMCGVCVSWGMTVQPDVTALFVLLAGVYGCFRLASEWPKPGERGRFVLSISAGVCLATVLFVILSLGVFGHLRRNVMPTREAMRGQTPGDAYIFATNWSLPPEDMLEFVAPCVYGIETGDGRGPYWGRLGRSHGWEESRRGFPNFRQHTVYMGVIQLVFAVYALVAAVRLRRRTGAKERGAGRQGLGAEAFFWWGAALVCTLLALGRYFPAYRLFYMLPYFSKIRCPVKFLHLVELAVCVLFATGLSAFLRDLKAIRGSSAAHDGTDQRDAKSAKHKRKRKAPKKQAADRDPAALWTMAAFGIGTLAIALGFAVASIAVLSFRQGLESYWLTVGIRDYALAMRGMMGALSHAAVLLFVCAGVFGYARCFAVTPLGRAAMLVVLGIALGCDLAIVDRRYVRVRDLTPFYAANPVAEAILSADRMGRTSYHLSDRGKFDPLWRNFRMKGVDMLQARQDRRLSKEYQDYFGALGKNIVRLWQLANTRFVVGPWQHLATLVQQHGLVVVMRFDVLNGIVQESVNGQFVLLRNDGCLPRALVYHSWQACSPADALARLGDSGWDPDRSVLVSGNVTAEPKDSPPSPVEIRHYSRIHIIMAVDTPAEGVLLLNDKYDPDWTVEVDGTEVEAVRCNYIMRGLHVPAGKHEVVLRYRPYFREFLLAVGGCCVLLFWALMRLVRRRSLRG